MKKNCLIAYLLSLFSSHIRGVKKGSLQFCKFMKLRGSTVYRLITVAGVVSQ